MKIRFYIDPETDLPHIYRHDVSEDEVEDLFSHPGEDRPGREGSRVAIGQTKAGRYLRVIYVPAPEPDSILVITRTNSVATRLKHADVAVEEGNGYETEQISQGLG